MIALGIDVGRWVGWCTLNGSRFLAGGVLDVEELGEDGVVTELCRIGLDAGVELVALERVKRVLPTLGFQRGAASQATRIADSSWLGGELRRAFLDLEARVETHEAADVRRHFVAPTGPVKKGTKKPDMDEVIEAVCAWKISGWPKTFPGCGAAYKKGGGDLYADRREHVADAAALALYAQAVLG